MVDPHGASSSAEQGESAPVVLRSPALYLGEVVLPPDAPAPSSSGLSGRRIKNFAFPLIHRLARRAPKWLAMLPFHAVVALAELLYGLRRNPLRQAAQDMAVIAGRRGREIAPRSLYSAYLRNARRMAGAYLALERDGRQAALSRVTIRAGDAERVRSHIAPRTGAIIAVGHNFGAVFSAARIGAALPVLIISRNSSTAQRTRMALEMFERMEVRVMMVRGGNPIALSRAMFRALREGLALAATVENVDYTEGRVEVPMFGTQVGVSPWAASIAAKRQVPVIPAWFASTADGVEVSFGDALVAQDPAVLVRHYMQFFETRVLEDPASWAYLADKHWRRVLRRAARPEAGSSSENTPD